MIHIYEMAEETIKDDNCSQHNTKPFRGWAMVNMGTEKLCFMCISVCVCVCVFVCVIL